MSTPDIERPDIVEQARAALSDWHEACARMDEVDADPDLEHEDRRHAQDAVTEAALEAVWLMPDLVAEIERLRALEASERGRRDARDAAIDALSEWRTKPDPDEPGRCPSIDPDDTLQCGRAIHDDDQCRLGGIGWRKGTQKNWTHRERALRMERIAETIAERLVDISAERDRARDLAARLEADGARLVERIEGMIAERLAEVDWWLAGLRPTPYAAGVRNCARSVLDILAEHRPGTMGGEG